VSATPIKNHAPGFPRKASEILLSIKSRAACIFSDMVLSTCSYVNYGVLTQTLLQIERPPLNALAHGRHGKRRHRSQDAHRGNHDGHGYPAGGAFMPGAAIADRAVQVKHLAVMMFRAKHSGIAAFAIHIAPSFTSTLSARGGHPLARSPNRVAAEAGLWVLVQLWLTVPQYWHG
jgi:hypothetical protein